MDEEDSQDELINKNISSGKSKRSSASILSDEEEDGDDSLEESSDSGEDVNSQDGEDEGIEDEEDEDEEEESDHEDGVKEMEGAVGTEVTDLGLSSDEDVEKCPICLNSFHEQPVATPQNCEHYFCLDCILEWAKNANSCPVDRKVFSNILLRKCYGGKVQKTITVQKPVAPEQEEQVNVDLEQTSCEVCGGTDREDRLLLCDGCDAGYHMECLTPPLNAVPVEEWFCPECAPSSAAEQLTEEDSSLPTTSSSRSAGSRPMRAIARTQHSERVRANVNRHRITQARTAAQFAPQYLMRSTWLDETINAVVAGLNTAVYVRDLTPRPRARRRRRRTPRKKYLKEGKDAKGETLTTKLKRRKRKSRRSKSKKALVKKKTTAQGRIAQSLGIKKPARSNTIPSVYRPCEQTLGSMRTDIGAASLSIYGEPFDLDPFDNGDEEIEQAPVQPSLLEAKQRGLSRSAVRSHQPVARPILAGLSRHEHGIPQEEVAEAAPVPDLLGSILSGQSLLLMDSSDVVINRDGTLKANKPAHLSSSRKSISLNSALEQTPSPGVVDFHSSREPAPSNSPSTHLSQILQPTPSRATPTSCPSLSHSSLFEHPRLPTPLPCRPANTLSNGTIHSQLGTCSIKSQPPERVANGAPDSHLGERKSTINAPSKKPPPKPVWVDVSVLPRIPKIKRENSSVAHGSTGSNSNNLPESSMTVLAGDKGRQNSGDQQRASERRQSRQRVDRPLPSSSFSNSFSTPSTSASFTSNSPSSSSAISFRISSSGNPWQARRISVPGQALPAKNKGAVKKDQKDKQLLPSYLQGQRTTLKSEVYDPFNPTGSDASDSDDENEKKDIEMNLQISPPIEKTVKKNEDAKHEIKAESMDFDLPMDDELSGMKVQLKEEPASPETPSWPSPSHQQATLPATRSESLATLVAYGGSPVVSDTDDGENDHGQLTKTLDHSRSSVPSNHPNEQKVKIEVKTEPDNEPSSVKSPVMVQVTKGNGFIHELSSRSGSSDENHKSKGKEKRTQSSSSAEEHRPQCASNSAAKTFDQSDKHLKPTRAENRKRSRSRSPHRRRSRSRSKEQSHIRDRRRSTRSSSSERSRKRTKKQERRDRYENREKEGQKRSRKKKYSHSLSRSRSRSRSRSKSRERRRERTFSPSSSSRSRDRNEIRSKRKRSRSTSRDRRRRKNVLEGPLHRERQTAKSKESTSSEKKEATPTIKARNANLVKESHKRHDERETTLSFVSIKKEADSRSHERSQIIDESRKQISEDVLSNIVLHKSHESKTIEIKEEKDASHSTSKESQLLKDQLPKQVTVEQIWPGEDSCGGGDDDDDDDALVINLSPPGPAFSDCEKVDGCEFTSLPVVQKEAVEVEHLQAPCPIKQETANFSDEEISVDYLIDNLDFIKEEMKDELVANTAGAVVEPQDDMVKESTGAQQEMESVLVTAGTKVKSQGKRVTWNIQEPTVSHPDKISKLALFKLKLKQEGSRKAASSSSVQITGQVAPAVQGGSKSAAPNISSPTLDERPKPGQERLKSRKGERLAHPDPKDKYMRKLHMQERAIEEVKLAIKPFYQKRDITKEEYKEIVRKAVQKVCHSKSGEINPVKVANLVKAYVDKYKHARKNRKAEEQQHVEGPEFSDSPG